MTRMDFRNEMGTAIERLLELIPEFPIWFAANSPLHLACRRASGPARLRMEQIGHLCHMNFTQTRLPQFAVALIAAGTLVGCGTYSEVREIRPFFRPIPVGTGVLVKAEAEIEKGLRADRSKPVAALDEYLAAAKTQGFRRGGNLLA
jgi:hypothetical protein